MSVFSSSIYPSQSPEDKNLCQHFLQTRSVSSMCSVTHYIGKNSTISCPHSADIHPEWFDILDPDFLSHTPIHWLRFKPQSCSSHFTLAVLYTLILIPGAFGNFLVISLFFRVRSLRSSTNILSLNLAIADLLMNSEIPFFIYNSLKCRPALGVLGCELHGFIGGLSGTAALATICGMAVERFFTIWYPFEMKCFFTTRNSLIASGFIWIYSLSFSLPPLLHIFNRYVPEGYLTSCSFDYLSKEYSSQIFVAVFFVGAYVLPLLIIVISYALIVIQVKKSGNEFDEPESKSRYGNRNAKVKKRVEIRLVKCALSLIGLWTLAWTPYAVVSFIGLVTDGSMLTPEMSMFPALFAKCASFIDPYVYGYSHPRYQKEIRTRIFTLCFPGRRRPIVKRSDKMSQCATFSMTSRSKRSGSTSDKKLETTF